MYNAHRCRPCPPARSQLRLSPQQVEEKRAHEAAVQEIQDEISLEDDDAKRVVLAAELKARQDKLEALMEGFEVRAVLGWHWEFVGGGCAGWVLASEIPRNAQSTQGGRPACWLYVSSELCNVGH